MFSMFDLVLGTKVDMKIILTPWLFHGFLRNLGQWSSGYDVALTTRRSPVQFRPGPLLYIFLRENLDHFRI
jgi:hypothetical protein